MLTIIENYWNALLAMTAEMSPYLILGFFIAGLLKAFVPDGILKQHLAPRTMGSVIKAAAIGIPLPLCSCGVIPTSVGLRKEGASHGACTSFLIATPQTGVDSIAATYSLMGLPFAIIRPIAALVTAVFGGFIVNKYATEDEKQSSINAQNDSEKHCCCCHDKENHNHSEHNEHNHEHHEEHEEHEEHCCCHKQDKKANTFGEKMASAMNYAFVDMLVDVGKWLVVGLLIAALITVAIPDQWLTALHDYKLLNMLIVLAIAIPMYVCATGSIPIAVSLMAKGLTPGAALVLLMAGPAVNSASMLVVGKIFGKKTLFLYLTSIIIGAVVFGLGIDYLLPQEWFSISSIISSHEHCDHGLSTWDWIWIILLVALMINAFIKSKHNHEEH